MNRLRHLIWYLAARLMIIAMVLGLMTVVFYYAMNAANIYVILKDGMAQRAQTVLMNEEAQGLEKYFSKSYLDRDPVINVVKNQTNPYARYDIKGFDHRLNMEWMWCWPWEDSARAVITERIPRIDGRILSAYRAQAKEDQIFPPKWQSGRYEVFLMRENGRWRIKTLVAKGAYEP